MPTIDLRKPIQIRAMRNDRSQYWLDAVIVAFSLEAVDEDDQGKEYLDLSFDAQYDDGGVLRIAKVPEIFGWGYGTTWRYKEKCCEQCKWSQAESDMMITYSVDGTKNPAIYICTSPAVPEDMAAPAVSADDGADCPHFEEDSQ